MNRYVKCPHCKNIFVNVNNECPFCKKNILDVFNDYSDGIVNDLKDIFNLGD